MLKKDFDFTEEELKIIKKLDNPKKIQDFLDNEIKTNFELNGETCYSPRLVLRNKIAHCMEASIFAACVLRFHGKKPLIMDFETIKQDEDHTVALFKQNGCWGAIGKTNHSILRYREPVYKNIRELAMSYFNEYFMFENGFKSLRTFSKPVNLKRFDKIKWMTREEDVWEIPNYLTEIKHIKILNRKQIKNLRPADKIEIKAAKLIIEEDPRKISRRKV